MVGCACHYRHLGIELGELFKPRQDEKKVVPLGEKLTWCYWEVGLALSLEGKVTLVAFHLAI